jgi:prephenate dehydrogenase
MSNNKEQLFFNKINIIGLGLIGGSIAKACKENNITKHISGFDIDQRIINFALENKIIDKEFRFESEFIKDSLTIIASPLSTYQWVFCQLKSKIDNGVIIDIGSTKSSVLDLAKDILIDDIKNFIACHPIAGSDKSGIANADQSLFVGKKVIISKNTDNTIDTIKRVKFFWQNIGCNVDFIGSKKHDKIFSLISHLPQFLAFIAKHDNHNIDDQILHQHFRLQNSNQKTWQEIFTLNSKNIAFYLKDYLINIDLIINKLENNQFQEILSNNHSLDFINQNNAHCNNPFYQTSSQVKQLLLNRIFLVLCFLNLKDVKKFHSHSGNGFKDFTAVAIYKQFLLPNLLEDKKLSLVKYLNKIKLKIYEFK